MINTTVTKSYKYEDVESKTNLNFSLTSIEEAKGFLAILKQATKDIELDLEVEEQHLKSI
jgi:hypothetical protein